MYRNRHDGYYRCKVKWRVAHRVRQARYLATARGRARRAETVRVSNSRRIIAGRTYLGRAATAEEAHALGAVASARKRAYLAQRQEDAWR